MASPSDRLTATTGARRTLRGYTATALLGCLLLHAAARVASATSPAERVVVLDAGSFLLVEAHQATLGAVLDRLSTHLQITLSHTNRLDLSRTVHGHTTGTVFEVVQWLVPQTSFVLLYEARKPSDAKPPRLQRIHFLSTGTASDAVAAAPSEAPPAGVHPPSNSNPVLTGLGTVPGSGTSLAGASALSHPTAQPPQHQTVSDPLKPNVPYTVRSEIKNVAEQLQAATPAAQLAIDDLAHADDPLGPPPAFLQPHSDVAQTTLAQQAERAQALAVAQLRALMEAYEAACQGAKAPGPC